MTNDDRQCLARSLAIAPHAISGSPDERHISTSYIERQNLTLRMRNRSGAEIFVFNELDLSRICAELGPHNAEVQYEIQHIGPDI